MAESSKLNLPPGEFAIFKKKFDTFDLNKDGIITMREFATVSKVLGYKLSKEEMDDIFGKRDLDDSGGITFDEFVVAMKDRARKAKNLREVREKFRKYEKKGSGYVTAEDALPILNRELGFDESKTESLLDIYDKNRDYRLSLVEFVDFIKRVEELKTEVEEAFAKFDTNNDGFVDEAELAAKLQPKGFTDQQVRNFMFKHDKDRDNRLNYQEFAEFWDVPIL